jgi:hypothetical protein
VVNVHRDGPGVLGTKGERRRSVVVVAVVGDDVSLVDGIFVLMDVTVSGERSFAIPFVRLVVALCGDVVCGKGRKRFVSAL